MDRNFKTHLKDCARAQYIVNYNSFFPSSIVGNKVVCVSGADGVDVSAVGKFVLVSLVVDKSPALTQFVEVLVSEDASSSPMVSVEVFRSVFASYTVVKEVLFNVSRLSCSVELSVLCTSELGMF